MWAWHVAKIEEKMIVFYRNREPLYSSPIPLQHMLFEIHL